MNPALAALIVHDLKNGLGALEAELLSLSRHDASTPVGQAHLHCAGLRQRFIQFLALYGAEGSMRAHSADESPQDLLSLVCRHQAPLLAPLGLQVVNTADSPPYWYFDRRLVRLALEAALHNAGRFARQGIELSARQEGEHLVFRIDDDGPGLQAPDPDDPQATGLGTALCEAVARAHDLPGRAGRVTLQNRAEGGARFELWLS